MGEQWTSADTVISRPKEERGRSRGGGVGGRRRKKRREGTCRMRSGRNKRDRRRGRRERSRR